MGNQDEINQFSRILDLLAMGQNVAGRGDLDPDMVRIACTLAGNDLSGLSHNREILRHQLRQRLSAHRFARTDNRTKRDFSMLTAFSMGFATVIVLVYVSLVVILPLVQHTGREPLVAGVSTGEATLNALLAAAQRLVSPRATLSPTPATAGASSTVTPTPFLANADAPSLMPAWTPPAQVDHVVDVKGDAGTVQQFSASLPSENGAASHTIQIIVNIPQAEGNAGRRRVDYALTCTGSGAENLRWGWWGWPPASLVCGSVVTSDGLPWSQNKVYLVFEVPANSTASVTYTITVTVSASSR